jgi:hypothetical protein
MGGRCVVGLVVGGEEQQTTSYSIDYFYLKFSHLVMSTIIIIFVVIIIHQ